MLVRKQEYLAGAIICQRKGHGMRMRLLTGVLGLLNPQLCVFEARYGREGEV